MIFFITDTSSENDIINYTDFLIKVSTIAFQQMHCLHVQANCNARVLVVSRTTYHLIDVFNCEQVSEASLN